MMTGVPLFLETTKSHENPRFLKAKKMMIFLGTMIIQWVSVAVFGIKTIAHQNRTPAASLLPPQEA